MSIEGDNKIKNCKQIYDRVREIGYLWMIMYVFVCVSCFICVIEVTFSVDFNLIVAFWKYKNYIVDCIIDCIENDPKIEEKQNKHKT